MAEAGGTLAATVLQASARVAGLCDAIDHLELAEVSGILDRAEELARAAVRVWVDRSPVDDLVGEVVDRAARRRGRYAPPGPVDAPPRPRVTTWEDLRGHLEWSDSRSDPDFTGRDRPSQLRHLSYSFTKLAAKLADGTDPYRVAPACLMLALRATSVCRARYDDTDIGRPPSVRR